VRVPGLRSSYRRRLAGVFEFGFCCCSSISVLCKPKGKGAGETPAVRKSAAVLSVSRGTALLCPAMELGWIVPFTGVSAQDSDPEVARLYVDGVCVLVARSGTAPRNKAGSSTCRAPTEIDAAWVEACTAARSASVAGSGGTPAMPRMEFSRARFSARRRVISAPCRATLIPCSALTAHSSASSYFESTSVACRCEAAPNCTNAHGVSGFRWGRLQPVLWRSSSAM